MATANNTPTPEVTEVPVKSAGESALDHVTELATQMANGTYFQNTPEVLKANRAMLGKVIEIADVIRKSHDELLDAEKAVGNPNVADYNRFRKKNESKKNPLADLFK